MFNTILPKLLKIKVLSFMILFLRKFCLIYFVWLGVGNIKVHDEYGGLNFI